MAGLQGFTGTLAEVEVATRALRVTQRPGDVGALGSYRKAMRSGTIGAGLSSASRVFSFRWAPTPNTNIAVVRSIQISAGDLAAFTAGFISLDLFISRSFSVQDSSGGTAGTLTGGANRMRTSQALTSGAGYYMTTTAAISGNTDTLDTDPFATATISISAAAAGAPISMPIDIFKPGATEWPLVLANNEGFVVKATVPATGTWNLGVTVAHDEFLSW